MPSRLRKFWRGDSEQSSQTLRPSPEKREKSFPVGIKELHKPKSAVVDLVFIHGLTGHRENTWTAKGSTSGPWPAVLLSEKIPNARILTFGYDALVVDWRGVVSNNRLGNHARNLAATLATHRENDETSDRPIIFIAHSLGGLVCEDALFTSKNSAEPHLQRIFERTYGIVFLGTPHSGSGLAEWAETLAKSIGLLKQTNSKILETLRGDSEILARVQSDFHTMLMAQLRQDGRSLAITCFYEELPIPGFGVVVPMHSAILPSYPHMGIREDHINMTKFGSVEHPGFIGIVGEIRRWIKELEPKSVTLTSSILSSLSKHGKMTVDLPPYDFDFVDRVILQTQIQDHLAWNIGGHQRLGLYGLGGSGKTQIALKYAHELQRSDSNISIFWLNAASRERFVDSYCRMASLIGINPRKVSHVLAENGSSISDPEEFVIPLVMESLKDRVWLMIIDNVDDTSTFSRSSGLPHDYQIATRNSVLGNLACVIPKFPHGKVIFISRNKQIVLQLTDHGLTLQVPKMTREEALSLFDRRTGSDTLCREKQDDLKARYELLEVLGYLPLAITQASAYIQANSLSARAYLDLYNDNPDARARLLGKDFIDSWGDGDRLRAVAKTWALSFDQIKKQSPPAAELLSSMSLFDGKGIPKGLLKTKQRDTIDFNEDLGLLKAYSMIESDSSNEYFNVHGLIQLATRQWMSQTATSSRAFDMAVLQLYDYYTSSPQSPDDKLNAALPHALTLLDSAKTPGLCKHNFIFNLFYTSSQLLRICHFKAAERITKRALALGIEFYPFGSGEVTLLYMLSANTSLQGGSFSDAESKLRGVMTMVQSTSSSIDIWAQLAVAKRLSHAVYGQGHLNQALLILEPAVSATEGVPVRLRTFDFFHARIIQGILMLNAGDYDRAERTFIWVANNIRDMEGILSENDVVSFKVCALTKLAFLFISRFNDARAMKHLREALKLSKKGAMSAESATPYVLDIHRNMSIIHFNQGHYAEAERLSRQVLSQRRKLQGEMHHGTVQAEINLAKALRRRSDRRSEALALCRHARRGLWSNSQEWTESFRNAFDINEVLGSLGELDDCESLMLDVQQMARNKFSQEHQYSLLCRRELASIVHSHGDYQQARDLKEGVLGDMEKFLGPDSRDSIIMRDSLGLSVLSNKEFGLAEQLIRRSLRDWEQLNGKDSMQYNRAFFRLGLVFKGRHQYREAEMLIREAYQKYLELFGPKHADTMSCANDLGLLLSEMHDFVEAEKYFEEASGQALEVVGPDRPIYIFYKTNAAIARSRRGDIYGALNVCQKLMNHARKKYARGQFVMNRLLDLYAYVAAGSALIVAAITQDTEEAKQTREVVSIESIRNRHDDCLKFIESRFGSLSQELLEVELRIAKQMTTERYFEEGVAAYKRALAIQVVLFGDRAEASWQSMLNLRQTLLELNRHDEADALLEQTSKIDSPTELSQDALPSITV